MIDKAQAIDIAHRRISSFTETALPLVLLEEDTIEKPYGWIFFYQSKPYLETGNISFALAGNGPFLVKKADGMIKVFGSAYGTDYYLEEYEASLTE